MKSSRLFRARTVYIVAGVWVLFLAAGGGRLILSGSDAQNAFLTIAAVIEGLIIAFAIWQAVHWALTRPETGRSGKVRWILGVSVFAAFLVGEFFVYASQNIYIAKSGWPPIGDLQLFFVKR